MLYKGRELDAVSLWSEWVDFPPNMDTGGEFAPLVRCPNPDHHTEKRHFQVNLRKPLVHCFAGCGISGTYERAISIIQGVKEREARRIILRHTRVGLGPRSQRKVRNPDGTVSRRSGPGVAQLDKLEYERVIPALGMDYLGARGLDAGSIATFGIGWDSSERRIVIPADDERGHTRFLIKRAVREKDWPKYLYAPEGIERNSLLFAACRLDAERVQSQGIVLVEGSLDCIRLHQHGIRSAVAILGSKLSGRQAEILTKMRPRRVYTMFDKDGAGARATIEAHKSLPKLPVFVCLYPRGKSDPAELSREEGEEAIEGAVSYLTFMKRLPERLKRREYGSKVSAQANPVGRRS